jgi:ubiquinone/menaquinone biosynthesis C-methylase UbiE
MSIEKLRKDIGGIDIYLLDQILKERYAPDAVILDAGCGSGRNLKWFYENKYSLYGVDINASRIEAAKKKYQKQEAHFSIQNLDALNFEDNSFDHVICSAVLHFAQNTQHFLNMFSELVRVAQVNGTIFVRMTSIQGLENFVKPVSEGVYVLPDKTNRFLLHEALLLEIMEKHKLSFLESIKTVQVGKERSMCTLVLKKNQ